MSPTVEALHELRRMAGAPNGRVVWSPERGWHDGEPVRVTVRPVLCEARCESGTGAGTCPTCGTVYR